MKMNPFIVRLRTPEGFFQVFWREDKPLTLLSMQESGNNSFVTYDPELKGGGAYIPLFRHSIDPVLTRCKISINPCHPLVNYFGNLPYSSLWNITKASVRAASIPFEARNEITAFTIGWIYPSIPTFVNLMTRIFGEDYSLQFFSNNNQKAITNGTIKVNGKQLAEFELRLNPAVCSIHLHNRVNLSAIAALWSELLLHFYKDW